MINFNNKLKKLENENNNLNGSNVQLRTDNDDLRKKLKLGKKDSKAYLSGISDLPIQRLETGEIVESRPDGSKIISEPNGDKVVKKPEGDEVEYKFNGPVVVKKGNGEKQSFMPSGDVITEYVT